MYTPPISKPDRAAPAIGTQMVAQRPQLDYKLSTPDSALARNAP
jgi:hypothetical protein